jgi:hypothetical protein
VGLELNRPVSSLFDESFAADVAREIVDQVGDRMLERVKDRTPIADLPLAYHGDFATWIEDRGGRKPGTLRERWRRTGVQGQSGSGLKVVVFNPDPVTVMVEHNTRPHLIRAHLRTRADGGTYQGLLRYPQGASFHFAVETHHPGTQGQHFLRNTLAEIEAVWPEIGTRVLDLSIVFYDERY